jgi:hypothetical protein
MIALAGMASFAMTGAEANAGNGFGYRGQSFGNNFVGRGQGFSSYRNFGNSGFRNFGNVGYGNSFYRGSSFQNRYRNPYQSIPRPNPYIGRGYGSFYGGGFGGGGFGGGCRR